MEKEQYWSRFAQDFEKRNLYVVGINDLSIVQNKVAQQKNLKMTLELGCGDGAYSKILTKEASQLTATDFSDDMVGVATVKLDAYDNINVEKANCLDLPYPDKVFDTIFMANLLHVIPTPEKSIHECKRVLKKDGKLIVLSFTQEGMTVINKICMIYRYIKTYGKPSPLAQTLTVNKTEAMLSAGGFHIEESALIGKKTKAIFIVGSC